jgi:hypothetical protein
MTVTAEQQRAMDIMEVLSDMLHAHNFVTEGGERRLQPEEVALVNETYSKLQQHLPPAEPPPPPLAAAVQSIANTMRAQVLLEQAGHLPPGSARQVEVALLAAELLGTPSVAVGSDS